MIKQIEELIIYCEIISIKNNLPETMVIEEIEINRNLLFSDDTLLPVISSYANNLGKNLFGEEPIKMNVVKNEGEGVCYAVLEEREEDTDDSETGFISKTNTIIVLDSVIQDIFSLNKKNKITLETLIENWRTKLQDLPENQILTTEFVNSNLNISLIENKQLQKLLKR